MPEILTESFCERCGTRYTFEAAAPSRGRLGRLRVVSRGLKNYVLSDESSLGEAFAEARSDDERSLTSQQLDAFHQTFNFCMSCRQYTCANCWNAAEGRCLTCAPHLGREVLQAPFPTLDPQAGLAPVVVAHGNGHAPDEAAWPAADLGVAPAAEGVTSDAEARAASDAATDGRAAMAAAETTAFLARFRPGESLDTALDAFEEESARSEEPVAAEVAELVDAGEIELGAAAAAAGAAAAVEAAAEEPAATVEAVEAEGPAAEKVEQAAAEEPAVEEPAVEAESPAAEQPSPEPAAAAATTTRPRAVPEPEEQARIAAAATAWQVVAPDSDGRPATEQLIAAPAWPPLPPGTEAPQWPPAPAWPAAQPGTGRVDDRLWAESSRDVLSPPGPGQRTASAVQPCVSCGLALSATARFCRRCGSQQG